MSRVGERMSTTSQSSALIVSFSFVTTSICSAKSSITYATTLPSSWNVSPSSIRPIASSLSTIWKVLPGHRFAIDSSPRDLPTPAGPIAMIRSRVPCGDVSCMLRSLSRVNFLIPDFASGFPPFVNVDVEVGSQLFQINCPLSTLYHVFHHYRFGGCPPAFQVVVVEPHIHDTSGVGPNLFPFLFERLPPQPPHRRFLKFDGSFRRQVFVVDEGVRAERCLFPITSRFLPLLRSFLDLHHATFHVREGHGWFVDVVDVDSGNVSGAVLLA